MIVPSLSKVSVYNLTLRFFNYHSCRSFENSHFLLHSYFGSLSLGDTNPRNELLGDDYHFVFVVVRSKAFARRYITLRIHHCNDERLISARSAHDAPEMSVRSSCIHRALTISPTFTLHIKIAYKCVF